MNVTYRDVPNKRRIKVHDLAHPCPAAGERSRTKQPTARLVRWEILRDLLVDRWTNPTHEPADVVARHLDALSPLEADLVRRMFLNVERILEVDPDVEIDLEGHHVGYDSAAAEVGTSVFITFALRHESGEVEHLRLKTGRSPSTAEEAAVLWSSAEEGDGFFDLMAWPGEIEEIEPPSDIESRLARLIETSPLLQREGVRPSRRCVWCARSALCGAYPAERTVPSSAPTLNLTKTDLAQIAQCHRRVAWRRVHGIPRDDGDDVDVETARSQGRLFHDMVVAAHDADDPDGAARIFLEGVPPSETADLIMMWEHHQQLISLEGLGLRLSEFPVGVTLLEGERAETRGVTLIAFIDLTARDARDSSVAIELKTGAPGDSGVEDDLYAVGMRRWVGDGPVTIHRHYVRSSPPVCEIVTLGPPEIDTARQRLATLSAVAHTWDWDDPLEPAWSVGSWCGSCEYRTTCESYRAG